MKKYPDNESPVDIALGASTLCLHSVLEIKPLLSDY